MVYFAQMAMNLKASIIKLFLLFHYTLNGFYIYLTFFKDILKITLNAMALLTEFHNYPNIEDFFNKYQ